MPCRFLQRTINRTKAGGEVRILDDGYYGVNANIGKSITTNGNGHTVSLKNATPSTTPAQWWHCATCARRPRQHARPHDRHAIAGSAQWRLRLLQRSYIESSTITLDACIAVYKGYGIVNTIDAVYTRGNNTIKNNANGETSGTLTALGGV